MLGLLHKDDGEETACSSKFSPAGVWKLRPDFQSVEKTAGLSSQEIGAPDCHDENWSLLSFDGRAVDELLEKFDGEIARIRRVDFLERVMRMALSGFPPERRFQLGPKIIIAVVTGEPVLVGHLWRIEVTKVIFAPHEVPQWETPVTYTLRLSGSLSAAIQEDIQMADVLIISGGFMYGATVKKLKKTFLDLTGPEVQILRLTCSQLPGMGPVQTGFAQLDNDGDDDYPLPQLKQRKRRKGFRWHDDEFDHNNNITSSNPWRSRNQGWKGDVQFWIFFMLLVVVVSLLSFEVGRLSSM